MTTDEVVFHPSRRQVEARRRTAWMDLVLEEAPIAIALTSTSVPGNRPVGTVVGTFSTTDPDAGNTFTYIIVPVSTLDGTSQFEIVGNQLRTKASFNPAVKSSYTLRVRSTDQSGLFTARLITITVTP